MLSRVDHCSPSWRKQVITGTTTPDAQANRCEKPQSGIEDRYQRWGACEALNGGGCASAKGARVRKNAEIISDRRLIKLFNDLKNLMTGNNANNTMSDIKKNLHSFANAGSQDIKAFCVNAFIELMRYLECNGVPRCSFEVPKMLIPMICVMFGQKSVDVSAASNEINRITTAIIPSLLGSQEIIYYLRIVQELCCLKQSGSRPILQPLAKFGMLYVNKGQWPKKNPEFLTEDEWAELKFGGCSDTLLTFLKIRHAVVKCKLNKDNPEQQDNVIRECFENYRTEKLSFLLSLHYFALRITSQTLFNEVKDYILEACADEELRRPALFLLFCLAGREDCLPVPGFKQTVLEFLENSRRNFLDSADVGAKGLICEPEWFIERLPLSYFEPTERPLFWMKLCGIDPCSRTRYLQFLDQQMKTDYVDLEVSCIPSEVAKTFPIKDQIQKFLDHPTQKVAIVLGDAGSGKSSFSIKLCSDLLSQDIDWIPLYVNLPQHQHERGDILRKAIEHCSLNPTHPVMKHRRILFVLDAYNEVTIGPINFIEESSAFEEFPMSKVIFTCRTDEVQTYKVFLHQQKVELPQVTYTELYTKLYIKQLTEDKVNQLIQLKKQKNNASAKQLLKMKETLDGLSELLRSPCMLTLCLSTEKIPDKLRKSTGKIQRADIYRTCIEVFYEQLLQSEQIYPNSVEANQKRNAYKQDLFKLAFIALSSGVIDCGQPQFSPISYFSWSIVNIPRVSGNVSYHYKFADTVLRDFLAAEGLVQELETAEQGSLNPRAYFNNHDILPHKNIRQFVKELTLGREEHFKLILLDIVNQAQRDDIKHASTNAEGLLQQLGYSDLIELEAFSRHNQAPKVDSDDVSSADQSPVRNLPQFPGPPSHSCVIGSRVALEGSNLAELYPWLLESYVFVREVKCPQADLYACSVAFLELINTHAQLRRAFDIGLAQLQQDQLIAQTTFPITELRSALTNEQCIQPFMIWLKQRCQQYTTMAQLAYCNAQHVKVIPLIQQGSHDFNYDALEVVSKVLGVNIECRTLFQPRSVFSTSNGQANSPMIHLLYGDSENTVYLLNAESSNFDTSTGEYKFVEPDHKLGYLPPLKLTA